MARSPLGWRLLARLLSLLPHSCDRLLFRLCYPCYRLLHQREYCRIEEHLDQSALRPRPPITSIYQNLFVNGMDSLRYLHGRKETRSRVHIVNRDILQQALQAGTPVVAVSIHSGAFEMLHRSLESFNRNIHLIASPMRSAGLDRCLNILRSGSRTRIYHPGQASQVMRHLLRKKGILALMLDQSRDPHGNVTELLGRKTRLFYRLPQEACRLGACIVTFRTMRRGDQHRVQFETLYKPGTPPQELAQGLTREIERWIQENPEQWTWNYPGNWNLETSPRTTL